MDRDDTIKLLKECDAGTKMAVASIDEVVGSVFDQKFKEILNTFKNEHTILGNEIHDLLSAHNEEDKEPSPIAKSMSWIKTNIKIALNQDDETVADLITEGCNMGIKSLNKYLNQYAHADEKSKAMCHALISCEERLLKEIRIYL